MEPEKVTKLRANCKDETGNQYGQLTVLYPVRYPNDTKIRWHCICSCGNTIDCYGSDLRLGKRTSCSKHCNSVKDETGKTYGYLTVLEKDPTPAIDFADRSVHWICRCSLCGTIKSVSGRCLRNGDTVSCGCLKSKGEQLIATILNELDVKFEREYKFEDLVSPYSKLLLRFDFAILNEVNKPIALIEYQGEQHDQEIIYFRNTLEQIQECDNIKIQYCAQHDLPLLCVTHINKKTPDKESLTEVLKEFLEEI